VEQPQGDAIAAGRFSLLIIIVDYTALGQL
jgi:hypothetical protein